MSSETRGGELALRREVFIRASIETVFAYFTDNAKFAAWFGEGSTIEPIVDGAVNVVYPNGNRAEGKVLAIESNRLIRITWGYPGEASPMAAGSTVVEVTLSERDEGTLVVLTHSGFPSEDMRGAHEGGWRYYLSVLAFGSSRDQFSGALGELVKDWCASWNCEDAVARQALLERCCEPDVSYRDAHFCVSGISELNPHMSASRQHMPGNTLSFPKVQNIVHGTALGFWEAHGPDGKLGASGQVFFELSPAGRIQQALAYWDERG